MRRKRRAGGGHTRREKARQPQPAPARSAPVLDAGRLEFHRDGIGLIPDPQDSQPGVALYIGHTLRDDKARQSCTCKRKRCPHRTALLEQVHLCHRSWEFLPWDKVFEASHWYRLAKILFEGQPEAAESLSLHEDGASLAFRTAGGATLVRYERVAGPGERLAERCGFALGPGPAEARAQIQRVLRMLQVTSAEEAVNQAGMRTRRQSFEDSFWYRLGYHALREHGTENGRFWPSVHLGSGAFILNYGNAASERVFSLRVPPARVEAVLAYLATIGHGHGVSPIPLRSLLQVDDSTELDLDLRDQIAALQAKGEARTLAERELQKFRYGCLVYLPEMRLLAELEQAGRERRFATPLKMELRTSRVPAGGEIADAEAVVSPEPSHQRAPRVFRDFDSVEVVAEADALDRSWHWLSVRYGFGSDSVSLSDLLEARQSRQSALQTGAGWIDLNAPAFAALDHLQALQDTELRDGERVRLSTHELLRLRSATTRPFAVTGDDEGERILERVLALQPSQPRPVPRGLRSGLRRYQKLGLDWLRFLQENGLAGLLCDEMGLGKTHQVMALFVSLAEQSGVSDPFLVVCPTSVVSHWRNKLRDHAPGLRAVVYHGPQRRLERAPGAGCVVVTSYGVLRNDGERLGEMDFAVAVFDEVQHVKNRDTRSFRAASVLPAGMKLGLTGTPIENDIKDLKSLFDLVLPGHLGSDETFNRRHGSLAAGERPRGLDELQRLVAPFVLRRLKSAVQDELPEKIEDERTCALSDEQVRLYREGLGTRGGSLVQSLRDRDEKVPYIHVFALLTLLKQICDHPAVALGCPETYREYASGKWELFVELLSESLDSGQKVVVFSQFLGMIDIIARHLREQQVGHVVLTGASQRRGELIERFNEDPDCRVFVGSLRAGGTGIDLIGGSVVIHYDRWWNAAREDQATDRVHRIGQKRAVQVFKLITEGTLEEKIAAIIERKRRLMEDVLVADEPHLAKLYTREELLNLLQPLSG